MPVVAGLLAAVFLFVTGLTWREISKSNQRDADRRRAQREQEVINQQAKAREERERERLRRTQAKPSSNYYPLNLDPDGWRTFDGNGREIKWNPREAREAVEDFRDIQRQARAQQAKAAEARRQQRAAEERAREFWTNVYREREATNMPKWKRVMGFTATDSPTPEQVSARFRQLAKQHHPDHGGDAAKMAELNEAKSDALQSVH